MNRIRYLLTVLLILTLRAADLLITYWYTPDLKCEWNPVISVFGASWPGLLFTQALLISAIAAVMRFYFFRAKLDISETGLSYMDFVYYFFHGRLRPWPGRMFSSPGRLDRHLVFNGFLFMMLAIAISAFAIAHNLLLLNGAVQYRRFVMLHYRLYIPMVFVSAVLLAFNVFFVREYARYRKSAPVRP